MTDRGHHIAEHSEPPRRATAAPPPPPPSLPGPGRLISDPLLTYDELEQLFACNRDHIFALVRRKELPVVYIGPRQPRVRLSDAEAFIAARTVPARTPEEN